MLKAGRMGAVGHLIGYGIGTVDLRSIWGDWMGDSQFKQLCVIAAVALIGTCGLTSWAVTERILLSARLVTFLGGGASWLLKEMR